MRQAGVLKVAVPHLSQRLMQKYACRANTCDLLSHEHQCTYNCVVMLKHAGMIDTCDIGHDVTLPTDKQHYNRTDLAAREQVEVVLVRRAMRSRTKGLLGSGNLPTTRLCPGSGALSTNTCPRHVPHGMALPGKGQY